VIDYWALSIAIGLFLFTEPISGKARLDCLLLSKFIILFAWNDEFDNAQRRTVN
jgi:hypothetical protein